MMLIIALRYIRYLYQEKEDDQQLSKMCEINGEHEIILTIHVKMSSENGFFERPFGQCIR